MDLTDGTFVSLPAGNTAATADSAENLPPRRKRRANAAGRIGGQELGRPGKSTAADFGAETE